MGQAGTKDTALRVWVYSVAVLALGAVLAVVAVQVDPPVGQPFQLPWWLLAAAFVVTERFVVDLDVRKQAQTLAFTEAPLTLGLVLATPSDLIAVRIVVGIGAIVIFRRSGVVKVVFNAGLFAAQASLAVIVYSALLGNGSAVEPRGWFAGLAGSIVFFLSSAVLVTLVMFVVGAEVNRTSQVLVIAVGLGATIAGSAAALAMASTLWNDSRAWVLLAIVGAAIGFFGLAYIKLRERHQALAQLNGYTMSLVSDGEVDDLAESVTAGIADLLNAVRVVMLLPTDREVVCYEYSDGERLRWTRKVTPMEWASAVGRAQAAETAWPRDVPVAGIELRHESAIVHPFGDGSAGILVVDGRRSVSRTFDVEDLQVLETAASHAATALHNAQLVDKLREEAQFRAHQALHDDVTDLPNQRSLIEQLDGQLAAGSRLVMLTARIHSLREVNETLGRAMGDEMLRQVSARLQALGRRSWCARSGTDEFTLVIPGGQDESDEFARQLVEAFDQPVLCNDVALAVTIGVGVALAPQHGTDAEMLLRRASLAASRSALDGTTVTTWASDRDPYDPHRLSIAADLRDAIPAGELEVHFQPQLDMRTGEIISAEALVRWAHPRLGQLRPDQFIAAAENTGAIDALTYHVLEVATTAAVRWRAMGWDLGVAVNLSARNLTAPRFADEVEAILSRTGLPSEALTLELTESSVMTEAERAMVTLGLLDALGIAISIDDFGTGYSSLAHLRRLPVSEIKIDKSFVLDLTTNESDEAIVRSMIELGHNLGLTVVVEGVETVEVRDRLHELGSDRLQGYLLSRPLTAAGFEHWMAERPARSHRPARNFGQVVNLEQHR